MLRQLNQEEVALYWHFIRDGLKANPMDLYTEGQLSNIQEAIRRGSLVCWVLIEEEELLGFMLTMITIDLGTAEPILLIYQNVHKGTYDGFEFKPGSYEDNFNLIKESVKDYCERVGIKKVASYTYSPRASKLYRSLGATMMYYLTWEV